MPRTVKRDRTTAALLEAAADVFAEQGTGARLADVAEAAGMGPATLYRYFPNREVLIASLFDYALDETSEQLAAADLDTVPFAEGIARICRALVSARSKHGVLLTMADQADKRRALERLGDPIRAVLRRGAAEGAVREDISDIEMLGVLEGLAHAVSRLVSQGQAGAERAATIASSVFLHGIARPGAGTEPQSDRVPS